MNLTTIIARVRNIVGDLNANQFSDPTLIGWINDGVRECAVENNLLQKRATSNLVSGTNEYALPADILKLYSIRVNGAKIDIYTLQDWQKQNYSETETGLPVMAYLWAGKYTLWPTPDSAYQVEVDYIYDPVDLATDGSQNAQAPPVPGSYHSRLVDYAIAQVALQDDNAELYAVKLEEFKTGIKKLEDQNESEEDLYPSISISPRDMGDGAMDWIEW
jgi:hypothetical protein